MAGGYYFHSEGTATRSTKSLSNFKSVDGMNNIAQHSLLVLLSFTVLRKRKLACFAKFKLRLLSVSVC